MLEKKFCVLSVAISIISQIIVICMFFGVVQRSDYGAYESLAMSCVQEGSFYPTETQIYQDYLFAPGMVNMLVLEIQLFGSTQYHMIINLIMNLFLFYCLWIVACNLFTKKVAYLSVGIFALLHSTIFTVAITCTEIPFLLLSLAAFAIIVDHRNRNRSIFFGIAGILLALANWIRPIAVIFVVAIVVWMVIHKLPKEKYAYLLLSMVSTICLIGILSKATSGYFSFQSTTSGVNLVMIAHDKSVGDYDGSVFETPVSIGFIEDSDSKTVFEKDSIWRQRSFEWIKDNPGRYLKQIPYKLKRIFIEDSWADLTLPGDDFFFKKMPKEGRASSEYNSVMMLRMIKSTLFYIVCILFLYSLWKMRKHIFTEKGVILLIFVLGLGSILPFAVSSRYHYPFVFSMVIWASYGLSELKWFRSKEQQ